MDWMLMPLRKYAQFSGRSQRKEFWLYWLGLLIVYLVLAFAAGFLASRSAFSTGVPGNPAAVMAAMGPLFIVLGLFWLAVLIPTLAVSVRRLHDTDRTGWWVAAPIGFAVLRYAITLALLGHQGGVAVSLIVDLAGFVVDIVLVVFYCLDGTRGPNRFGPDPKGPDLAATFA